MNKLFGFLSGFLGAFSGLALIAKAAQQQIGGILNTVGTILQTIIPILITLAIVFFFWALITYIMAKEDEAKKKARNQMISGLIALFVMFAFFGIIRIIMNTFEIEEGAQIDSSFIPTITQ